MKESDRQKDRQTARQKDRKTVMEIILMQQTTFIYVVHILFQGGEYLGIYNTKIPSDRVSLCRDVQSAEKGTFVPTRRDVSNWSPICYKKLRSLKKLCHKKLLTLNTEGGSKW